MPFTEQEVGELPQQMLPGTNIQLDLQGGQDCRKALDAVFSLTGGIYLSQMADMVDIPAATLQNWIKRRFVASPQGKRYSRRQTCRIILIGVLRHTLPIDAIVTLLSSINNDLADERDDLIDDSVLYLYFCDLVLFQPPVDLSGDMTGLDKRIEAVTSSFCVSCPEDRSRLNHVLRIMVLSYESWQLKQQAEILLDMLRKEKNHDSVVECP